MNPLLLTGGDLTPERLVDVARGHRPVTLAPEAREAMLKSLAWVRIAAKGEIKGADGESMPIYGVNTGYGSLARVKIASDQIRDLSANLIMSHAAGVGDDLPEDAVRGLMLLRANALSKGASGCRPELVETLLAMLNKGVTPVIPSQGSCGSSGDLAPLAHLGLVVFDCGDQGSGEAWFDGERFTGAEAMKRAGITRLIPSTKDGLAMTNGAQLCASLGGMAVFDAQLLLDAAEIAAGLSWEGLRGVSRALHPGIHALRPYQGAVQCAANLRALLSGSTLVDSLPDKLQDAYSIRCTPMIVGAARDGVNYASSQISVELNAVTDNPVILLDADSPNKAYSGGLFHGEPVGMACDHLKLAIAEVGALSERRIHRLTTGTLSAQLPPLLAESDRPSLGLMVPGMTAASLVSSNRSKLWPSTGDSMPTCEDQEDIVAMSTTAARIATEVVENTSRILAVELLSAGQAVRVRLDEGDYELGVGTRAAYDFLVDLVGRHLGRSTPAEDIQAIADAMPALVAAVRKAAPAFGAPHDG